MHGQQLMFRITGDPAGGWIDLGIMPLGIGREDAIGGIFEVVAVPLLAFLHGLFGLFLFGDVQGKAVDHVVLTMAAGCTNGRQAGVHHRPR